MDAGERADNLERQAEEAEALCAIYGEENFFSNPSADGGGVWEIRVPFSGGEADDDDDGGDIDLDPTGAIFAATGKAPPSTMTVRIVPLESYPSRTPPLVELDEGDALLPFGRHDLAMAMVEQTYGDNPQEVMMFGWIEWLRGMLRQWREEDATAAGGGNTGGEDAGGEEEDNGEGGEQEDGDGDGDAHVWDPVALEEELAMSALEQSERDHREERRRRQRHTRSTAAAAAASESASSLSIEDDVASRIVHGVPFTVMKSTFQAHLCAGLTSVEQVDVMMAILRQNGKVARATHNIMAYRIQQQQTNGSGTVTWAQDHDEDGENAAGGRLLHMLQVTKAANVCVVVSRWYGGVHLGPDRFRQINNAARELLERCGEIEGAGGAGAGGAGAGGGRKK